MIASENTGRCGEAISPGSIRRELLAQECKLGLVAAQLRLGLVDVFLTRAGDRQVERLLVDLDPRIRDASGGLGCVGILLAGKVLAEQLLLARELPAGVDRVGP